MWLAGFGTGGSLAVCEGARNPKVRGVAALATPWVPVARRRELAVLGLWAALLIGFYAFYFHSGESWWYLRFILPAFPALLLAAPWITEPEDGAHG